MAIAVIESPDYGFMKPGEYVPPKRKKTGVHPLVIQRGELANVIKKARLESPPGLIRIRPEDVAFHNSNGAG